jgi:hypothetical protein
MTFPTVSYIDTESAVRRNTTLINTGQKGKAIPVTDREGP